MSPVRRQAPRGQQPEPPLAQTQPLSLRPLPLALASFPLPLLPLPPFPFTVARGIFFFFLIENFKKIAQSQVPSLWCPVGSVRFDKGRILYPHPRAPQNNSITLHIACRLLCRQPPLVPSSLASADLFSIQRDFKEGKISLRCI